jgi:CHAT domain-containing protein
LEVEAFRSAILRDDADLIDGLGRSLYSKILGHMLARLPAASRIVLIPDKALHHLPFAALKNPESGRYLVEERTLETAPSARIYLHSLALAAERPSAPPSLLLVADPELDLTVLPHLTRLSFSQEEVVAIQGLFGDTRVLSGGAATKRALLAEAPRHSLLHLATHAVVNQSDPMYSYLALSPDGDSGLLYAHELYEADLRGLDLVFLAGCETATGPISKSEGVFSLARPFLAAGVPAVVGIQWKLGDHSAALFARIFYRYLQSGKGTAEALQSAQVEVIRNGENVLAQPSFWSGFTVVGGSR